MARILIFLCNGAGIRSSNNQAHADKFASEGFLVVMPDLLVLFFSIWRNSLLTNLPGLMVWFCSQLLPINTCFFKRCDSVRELIYIQLGDPVPSTPTFSKEEIGKLPLIERIKMATVEGAKGFMIGKENASIVRAD